MNKIIEENPTREIKERDEKINMLEFELEKQKLITDSALREKVFYMQQSTELSKDKAQLSTIIDALIKK